MGFFTNSLLNSLLLVTMFLSEVALSSGPADAEDVPEVVPEAADDTAEDEPEEAFEGDCDCGAEISGSDVTDDVFSVLLLHPKNTEKTIMEAISNDAVFILFITMTSFLK